MSEVGIDDYLCFCFGHLLTLEGVLLSDGFLHYASREVKGTARSDRLDLKVMD